jgi:hypothetical protein
MTGLSNYIRTTKEEVAGDTSRRSRRTGLSIYFLLGGRLPSSSRTPIGSHIVSLTRSITVFTVRRFAIRLRRHIDCHTYKSVASHHSHWLRPLGSLASTKWKRCNPYDKSKAFQCSRILKENGSLDDGNIIGNVGTLCDALLPCSRPTAEHSKKKS